MAVIHVLDEVTANQIAAGEVVERPVNAVKELVENAVDAGASSIEVEIADGGMTYIRVTDDGCGMTEEDAKLSVIRHATSKISSVDNIYHIASLGFRGEALPSIASVSRATITTRRHEDVEGTALEMTGGEITEVKPAGAPAGTTVEVRDLFYNVPARKKFLKSERTESSRINSMVGKLSLANPDIAFRLINNGRTVIETPGNGRLVDVISSLYGTKTAGEMLPVEEEGENIALEGLISKPSLLKSSRQYQTIIINRRVVESAVVSKAVDNAYHSLLPKNGYPLMVLSFQVPPESIDVNVHPQKREIKFSDEQTVFRLVYHGVLGTLTSQSTADTIAREMIHDPGHEVVEEKDFKPGSIRVEDKPLGKPDIGLSEETRPKTSWGEPAPSYEGRQEKTGSYTREKRTPAFTPDMEKKELFTGRSVFEDYRKEEPRREDLKAEPLFEEEKQEDPVIPLGQVSDCFILCQHGKDLLIIDQHAAHERVRYDHLAERAEGIPVQEILIPYLIHVDIGDVDLLADHKGDIERLGITFEQAGPDVIRITGAPEDLSAAEMERVVGDIVKAYHEKDVPSPETMRHRMMAYAACRGAIKRGDPLNIRQMKELIHDLFHTSRPFVCPHGRPTIVKFTPGELGRLFKRP
ncbi:DNA mismatch repair endonuclease MutL [uncultured Dialister sp.]|jgi:DNA mismatch repair protein MutL|uniref:DNA mismatch repair endonuclease MutL n=1 Tax=uncultured Dialister sp. TaxID=278064 RepID=UPI00261FA32F|nr:DNA mismatch repair endonuclease MutL [uncultured Dialister sp.]